MWFHKHAFDIKNPIKEINTCDRHEIWVGCSCGKIIHQVIRQTPLHDFGPYEYGPGTNTTTWRGVELRTVECRIKTRTCSKCNLEEITLA